MTKAQSPGDASVAISGDAYGPISTTFVGTQVIAGPAVPVKTAAKDPTGIFAAVGIAAFTGREWLAAMIDEFIAGNSCGYVFIEAHAGLGKTAFAAWLVRSRGYLSHFSRYSGGRSVRATLQNLSAQLIQVMGANGRDLGDLVPGWAETPAGFESLLARAAAAAQAHDRRLVIVVDGMDEAEPSGEPMAFGLPTALPPGVFVIGTCRTGHFPGQPDCPAVTVMIDQADPRNQADIRRYLTRLAAEGVLAARLAEAGIDADRFAGLLAERSGGVWVYLRYILQELRDPRAPGVIGGLPAGLRGYYAAQIGRWQQDAAWEQQILPLLATLGAAEEPLPPAILARLAGGLTVGAVRRHCDLTLRPLLAVAPADPAGELAYQIYHESFREILDPAKDPAAPASDLAALSGELRHAAAAAHDRIASLYLDSFGGLAAGLPALAADPGIAQADGGYPLLNLARHLHRSGRAADLRRLLIAQHQRAGGAANTWYTAHDCAGGIGGYADDLVRALRISAAAVDRDITRSRVAAELGVELRYTLMIASITTRTSAIPAELPGEMIASGMWSVQRALGHARQMTGSWRAQALTAICARASTDDQPGIAAEALAAATHSDPIRGCASEDYANALIQVAQYLPAGPLEQALATAASLDVPEYRASALIGLVPHLPADRCAERGQAGASRSHRGLRPGRPRQGADRAGAASPRRSAHRGAQAGASRSHRDQGQPRPRQIAGRYYKKRA